MKITKDYVDRVHNELKDTYPGLTKVMVRRTLMYMNKNIIKCVKLNKNVYLSGVMKLYSRPLSVIKRIKNKNLIK